jgi:hypothetical protein
MTTFLVAIAIFGLCVWPFAGPFVLWLRSLRTDWKKPPLPVHIPQQRGPHGMTKGTRDLFLAAYTVPAPAPTETTKDAA